MHINITTNIIIWL